MRLSDGSNLDGIVRLSGNGAGQLRVRHNPPMNTLIPLYYRHRFPSEIISHSVWLYFRFALSYRDVEEMMRERGLMVDHVTVWRWVQAYALKINRRMLPHLKLAGASYRIDETYMKVGKQWKYHNPRT